MDHAGCESTNCRELFGACNRAIRFDAVRDLLADSDHMADLAGVVGPHRNLADDPVADVAFCRWSLLFDALDIAPLAHALKLFLQHVARLAREHFEHVLAEY